MTDFNIRSTDVSFESCDCSTFDKDYCPWTDNDFSDTDFEEDVADPSRKGFEENPEDIPDKNVESEETIKPDIVKTTTFKTSLLLIKLQN